MSYLFIIVDTPMVLVSQAMFTMHDKSSEGFGSFRSVFSYHSSLQARVWSVTTYSLRIGASPWQISAWGYGGGV